MTASVTSTQERINGVFSTVKGGVDGATGLAKRAVAIASGQEKRDREERERREREEARKQKERDAIVIVGGEPIT